MTSNGNARETGVRKYPAQTAPDPSDEVAQKAAKNKKPALGTGLTEKQGDVNEKTRHSDGQKPSQEARTVTGAGPALAEHSKDAQNAKDRRR